MAHTDPTGLQTAKTPEEKETQNNDAKIRVSSNIETIIQEDGYIETDSPKVGDAGLYFSTEKLDFSKVGHSVRVAELGGSSGQVSSVVSKDAAQPKISAPPGPGAKSAWNDKNAKLRYFTQNSQPKK